MGLPCFIPVGRVSLKRMQPDVDAVLFIAAEYDHVHHRADAKPHRTQQITKTRAADIHHDQADRQQQHSAGQMRLNHHESAGNA